MRTVSRKVVLAAVAALALASLAGPAAAHRGKGSGKKAVGTVASFDGTTLTVTGTDGTTTTATVTEDSKIRVAHRGHHGRGKGHGNPSKGSAEDLAAGAFVLKMTVDEDGTLDKIHVRPALHDTDQHGCPIAEEPEVPEGTDTTEGSDEGVDAARASTEVGDSTGEDTGSVEGEEGEEGDEDGTEDPCADDDPEETEGEEPGEEEVEPAA